MVKREKSPFHLIFILSLFFHFNSETTTTEVAIILNSFPLTAILYMKQFNIVWCFVQSTTTFQRPCRTHVSNPSSWETVNGIIWPQIFRSHSLLVRQLQLSGFVVTYFCSYLHIYLVLQICLRAPRIGEILTVPDDSQS